MNVDGLGIIRGRYRFPYLRALRFGERAIRNCIKDQLVEIKQEGLQNIGETPCLMKETGIPFDMDQKLAYRTGNFSSQYRAMDAINFALEGAAISFTIWNYSPNVTLSATGLRANKTEQPCLGRSMESRRLKFMEHRRQRSFNI